MVPKVFEPLKFYCKFILSVVSRIIRTILPGSLLTQCLMMRAQNGTSQIVNPQRTRPSLIKIVQTVKMFHSKTRQNLIQISSQTLDIVLGVLHP